MKLRFRKRAGSTLLEVMGALAIIVLLASLAAPNIIRQVDRAKITREKSDLKVLLEALTRSILRTKSIPLSAAMPEAIARECALPPAQITTTPVGTQRALLVEPGIRIGSGLPYSQSGNAGLTEKPSRGRLLLVSSLSRPNPLTADETAPTTVNFESIWNAPDDVKPSTWTRWRGEGYDLKIERLTLLPLFHRLILVNHDPSNDPRFNLDQAMPDVLASSLWEAYYLSGSVVGLYVGTNLQTRHLLLDDASFVFERGLWRSEIGRGVTGNTLPDALTESARRFLDSAWNQNAQKGASQMALITALYGFMMNYAMWGSACPHFNYHRNLPVNNPGNVPEYQMINDFGRRNGYIDNFSGTGGLLK